MTLLLPDYTQQTCLERFHYCLNKLSFPITYCDVICILCRSVISKTEVRNIIWASISKEFYIKPQKIRSFKGAPLSFSGRVHFDWSKIFSWSTRYNSCYLYYHCAISSWKPQTGIVPKTVNTQTSMIYTLPLMKRREQQKSTPPSSPFNENLITLAIQDQQRLHYIYNRHGTILIVTETIVVVFSFSVCMCIYMCSRSKSCALLFDTPWFNFPTKIYCRNACNVVGTFGQEAARVEGTWNGAIWYERGCCRIFVFCSRCVMFIWCCISSFC